MTWDVIVLTGRVMCCEGVVIGSLINVGGIASSSHSRG